jgi:hypothetical protein
MSSWFDSEVYQLQHQIDFVRPETIPFMKHLAQCNQENEVTLIVSDRHDVSSGFWWTLRWTDHDGEPHAVGSQYLDLCFWRALHVERLRERNRRWRERKVELEAHGFGFDDYSI